MSAGVDGRHPIKTVLPTISQADLVLHLTCAADLERSRVALVSALLVRQLGHRVFIPPSCGIYLRPADAMAKQFLV